MLTAAINETANPVEAGPHEAVCYTIADLGTHWSDMYQVSQRKVLFIWEIPSQRITVKDKDSGQERDLPRVISKQYTFSLNEKANLRRDLVSWRGVEFTPQEEEGFQLKRVLGASCLLNVVHKAKQKGKGVSARVDAVLRLKGKKLKPENPMVLYGIEENGLDIPDTLPEWVVAEIKKSDEYQALLNPGSEPEPPAEDDPVVPEDDDIPF